MNQVIAGYRHKAKKSEVAFVLTAPQFQRISASVCFYCGRSKTNIHHSSHGTGDFAYNGLDRIDPKKGYTLSNTVAACRCCNFAKSNRSQGEFIRWIGEAHEYLAKTAMAEQWDGCEGVVHTL